MNKGITKSRKIFESIFLKMVFLCVIYGVLMSEFLFNRQDGIWNGTDYLAGDWELSIGRWVIRYLDRMHFGISVHPFSTIITLIFFVLGTCLLVNLFNIEIGSFWDYLISGLFLGNMVICISISYLYTSSIYGISFMLSILCVWLITKSVEHSTGLKSLCKVKTVLILICASACLTMVLSLYQAYLGCITLVALFYLIYILYAKRPFSYIRNYILASGVTGVVGFVVYEVVLKLELKKYGVEMSSYNGANTLSVKNIISNLLPSVKRAYITYKNYLLGIGNNKWNLLAGKYMLIIVVIMCLLIVGLIFVVRKNILSMIIAAIAVILTPVAANIVVILIPSSAYLEQQTAPCALILPLIICILAGQISEIPLIKIKQTVGAAVIAVSLIIMWGSIYQTQVDQEAIRQGTNATRTLSQSILSQLLDDGLYSADRKYAVIGNPCGNPTVYLNSIYYKANGYAQVAGGYWKSSLDARTWNGIFTNLSGVNLPRCDDDEYQRILQDQRVKEMPLFPAEDSIQEIDGIVVIHIS